MKPKRLVTFGDSWPAGVELTNPQHAFPVQIAERLGIEYFNASVPGTSVDQACYYFYNDFLSYQSKDFKWFDKSDKYDDIILFCLTGSVRSWFFDQGQAQELHPHNPDVHSKAYYAYLHSNELAQNNLIKNIVLVQNLCLKNNIPCYFVANWEPVIQNQHIDRRYVYPETLMGILGMSHLNLDENNELDLTGEFCYNDYIRPNQSHPNELGHSVIAEKLADWIAGFNVGL